MTALSTYRDRCRAIHANPESTETSYYPALESLFGAFIENDIQAVSGPSANTSDKPDLGLYDSTIPLLYVEVKLPDVPVDRLLKLEQAERYAKALAGLVLITNLNDFVLARLEGQTLVEHDRVRLFDGDLMGETPPKSVGRAASGLNKILKLGYTAQRTMKEPYLVSAVLAAFASKLADVLPADALRPMKLGFKEWLGADLDDNFLVSTAVQAMVYGMFATWLEAEAPNEFKWQDARDGPEIGVIAEIVYSALSPAVLNAPGITGLLESAAGALKRIDRDELAGQFDDRAIEYFYEPFLAEFAPQLRDKLGVWYTPRAIADYQVARADHHLKQDLGIEDGLADSSVVILDPAAGTGTYIAAVYDFLTQYWLEQGEEPGPAAELLREAAITRIIGFEILPAAVLVADLHLRRHLREKGAPLGMGQRSGVYLTNSLTGWFDEPNLEQMTLPWQAAKSEIEATNQFKRSKAVLVVLGNPPYQGYSSAETAEEKRLVAPWIEPLWPVWRVRKHRLNDLYARFWAAAALRITQYTGTGVVSFITNRKWLAGRSYPAMRENLLSGFDKAVVDDLGGDTRGAGGHSEDQSVFSTEIAAGVTIGTAIVTAVRYPESGEPDVDVHRPYAATTQVFHRSVSGSAKEKRATLARLSKSSINSNLKPLPTNPSARWKLVPSTAVDEWPRLDDYFEYVNSGIQPVRDLIVTDLDEKALRFRMERYFDPDVEWEQLAEDYTDFLKTYSGYAGKTVRQALLTRNSDFGASGIVSTRLVRCLWKPLDGRWLYWETDSNLLNRPRPELVPYNQIVGQQWLIATRTRRRDGAARPMVSTAVPTFGAMDPDARAFPLWSPEVTPLPSGISTPVPEKPVLRPNIGEEWISAGRREGLTGSDGDIAEVIFYAVCGIAASNEWLETQPIEHDDFPSVPIPVHPDQILAAARLGREYAQLCDPWAEIDGVTKGSKRSHLRGIAVPDSVNGPDPILEYGVYRQHGGRPQSGDLLWAGNAGWRNVPDSITDYSLGGWNPIRKHLSYFVNRPLELEDRRRITSMACRIAELNRIAKTADSHFRIAKDKPLDVH